MKIAVAGARGFVGEALVEKLKKSHEVIALSRSQQDSSASVQWRACDLFSLLDAEKALAGADVAVYLVHSMSPSAQLTQARFDDLDLIVADNFVRAAQKMGIQQIIYLGGMRPQDEESMSEHLHSRWEVEQVFRRNAIASTILRAAVILGPKGSSFHIMARLVERLPFMLCPSWTQTRSHPVALSDVVKSIEFCVGNKETFNKVYEIGAEQAISYNEMMMKIAHKLGLTRTLLPVPVLTPRLSALWVRLITGAPRALVRPLIESLKTSLPLRAHRRLHIPGHSFKTVDEALDEALADYDGQQSPVGFKNTQKENRVVRSVQRLPLPLPVSAEQVAQTYLKFLPRANLGLLKVVVNGPWIYFCWRWPFVRLMVLEHAPARSSSDRQLFYIRGGLLAKKTARGRLEFRETLNGEAVLSAIHDFSPRLPWFFYRSTQAVFHLWVMKQFGRYLSRRKSLNA